MVTFSKWRSIVDGTEYNAIPDSVVNHYPINNGTGITVSDNKSTADGTINGATWVSDSSAVGGFYLSFDGTDTVEFSAGDWSYTDQSDFTVTAWFSTTQTDAEIVSLGTANSDDGGWTLTVINGNISLRFGGSDFNESSLTVNDGVFHYAEAAYDSSNETIFYRVDDQTESINTNGMLLQSGISPNFGSRADGSSKSIVEIDEVTISDSILSQSDSDLLRSRRS